MPRIIKTQIWNFKGIYRAIDYIPWMTQEVGYHHCTCIFKRHFSSRISRNRFHDIHGLVISESFSERFFSELFISPELTYNKLKCLWAEVNKSSLYWDHQTGNTHNSVGKHDSKTIRGQASQWSCYELRTPISRYRNRKYTFLSLRHDKWTSSNSDYN